MTRKRTKTLGLDPIDVHIGARMRGRRAVLLMPQKRLAEQLGLSFQAVQKYEAGRSRVSASILWSIAKELGVSLDYFIEGLSAHPNLSTLSAEQERVILHVARALMAISPHRREALMDLIHAMASVEGAG